MGVAKTEANIGLLMQRIGQKTEALIYFKNAMCVFKKLNVSPAMSKVYQCIGSIYFDFRQIDSCLNYFELARNVNEKAGFNDPHLFGNLSNAYSLKKDYKKQTEYLNRCIKSLEAINDTTNQYYLWIYNLGNSELHNKNIEKGLSLIARGISGMKRYHETGGEQGVLMHYNAGEAFYNFGKTKEGYLYLKKSFQLADTMHKSINYKQINALKAQYEDEKKELQIASLNKEKILNEEQLKMAGRIKVALSGILLLTLGVLVLTYRNYKQKKNDNRIINAQKHEVEEKNKEITDSINYAHKIQKVILPSEEKWRSYLPESFVLYLPKAIVAGDFYWMEDDDDFIYVAAADCTGHGVPGAMMSVLCSTALTKTVLEEKIKEPADILNRTREIIIDKLSQSDTEIKDGMDICLVRINKQKNTDTLVFSGANRSLFVAENSTLVVYTGDKQPVGKHYNAASFTQQHITISPQSTIYLFTDGYADQFGGEKNKKLGSKQLSNYLRQITTLSLPEQKELLTKTFLEWKNKQEQTDDVTVIGVRPGVWGQLN